MLETINKPENKMIVQVLLQLNAFPTIAPPTDNFAL